MTDTGGQNVQDIIQRNRDAAYEDGRRAGFVCAGLACLAAWAILRWVW